MSDVRTYTRSQLRRMKDRTDWGRLADTSDAEVEHAIAGDRDWAGLGEVDWSKADLVVPPRKKAISIRLDEDVLDFFKEQGSGYQRRMNAVLRAFMREIRKGGAKPGGRRHPG